MPKCTQSVKKYINLLLERLIAHRLENLPFVPGRPEESYRRLAGAGFAPASIIDIGAAQGSWTRAVLPIFPKAAYWLAEPLNENMAALVQLRAERENVRLWKGAIGSHNGSEQLFAHGDQTSCFRSEWGGEARLVAVRTLDQLRGDGEIPDPDLIKIDVQGAELEVMAGAQNVLAATTVVQMEVSFRQVYQGAPLAHEVIREMARHGFRIYDICDVFKRPADRALLQADVLFARDGKWFQPERWNP